MEKYLTILSSIIFLRAPKKEHQKSFIEERKQVVWKHGLAISTFFFHLLIQVAIYTPNPGAAVATYSIITVIYLCLVMLAKRYAIAYQLLPFYMVSFTVFQFIFENGVLGKEQGCPIYFLR